MIYPTWSTFRYWFATKYTGAENLTFTPGAPSTIVRAAGVWPAAMLDSYIDITGTASNNTRYHVTAVPGIATIEVAETVVAEGPVAGAYMAVHRDVDGLERWPVSNVRAGAIGNITGTPTPYALSTMTLTINGGAADAVYGTDEYDWYLSQRTDVVASQLLYIAQKPSVGGLSYSGSVQIVHTSLAETELDFSSPSEFTPDKVPELFKYCHLYVRRKSDDAIQWLDLLRAMTANC